MKVDVSLLAHLYEIMRDPNPTAKIEESCPACKQILEALSVHQDIAEESKS